MDGWIVKASVTLIESKRSRNQRLAFVVCAGALELTSYLREVIPYLEGTPVSGSKV